MVGLKTTYKQANTPSNASIFFYTHASQICGKLASESKIVVAMEHHDGSAPAFASFSTNGDIRHRFYVRDDILE